MQLEAGYRITFMKERGVMKGLVFRNGADGSGFVGEIENVPQDLKVQDGSLTAFAEAEAAKYGLIVEREEHVHNIFNVRLKRAA